MSCSFCDTGERKTSKLVKVEPPIKHLVIFLEHPACRRQKITQTTFSFPFRHSTAVQRVLFSFQDERLTVSFCALAVNSNILFDYNIRFSRFHCDLLKNWFTFWETILSNTRQTRIRRLVAIHSHYEFPV